MNKVIKKLMTIALVMLFVFSFTISASAATTLSVDVTYDSCSFYVYAKIGSNTIHNLIEGVYYPSDKSYEDYTLRTTSVYHILDSEGLIIYGGTIYSSETTRITSIGRTIDNLLYSTRNGFFVNNESIYPSTYLCNY